MIEILIITAGADRFCIDMKQIESVHTGQQNIKKKLPELVSEPVSLRFLLNGNEESFNSEYQLIVLRNNGLARGLFVDNTTVIAEKLSPEAVQKIPSTLSASCRNWFPEAVVLENEAIPVLTAENLLKLMRTDKKEC